MAKATTKKTRTCKSGSSSPPVTDRAKQLKESVTGLKGLTVFSKAPEPIIVRTSITSLNRALGIGGYPCQMLGVLHGPSMGGKSMLLSEVLASALRTGGWAAFVDAEARAVDKAWYERLLGDLENVIYGRPETFEEAIKSIEVWRKRFRDAKAKKEVPAGAVLAIGIDSINKLVPANELKEFMKGKVGDRGYPLRAMLTSRWLDQIIPTLKVDESLIFIQREGVNVDAGHGQRKWRLKGGAAITYDAGWSVRVTSSSRVRADVSDDVKEKPKIGEKHRLDVMKNSMAPTIDLPAYFYSSSGIDETPLGFDFAREVREEAIVAGLLKYKGGTGYLYNGEVVASKKDALPAWLATENDDGVPFWKVIADELDRRFD